MTADELTAASERSRLSARIDAQQREIVAMRDELRALREQIAVVAKRATWAVNRGRDDV